MTVNAIAPIEIGNNRHRYVFTRVPRPFLDAAPIGDS